MVFRKDRSEKGKHSPGRHPADKPQPPQPPEKPGKQKGHMDDTKSDTKQSGQEKQPEKTPEEKMADALDKSLKAHVGTIQLDPSELKAVATDLIASQKEGDQGGKSESGGQSQE